VRRKKRGSGWALGGERNLGEKGGQGGGSAWGGGEKRRLESYGPIVGCRAPGPAGGWLGESDGSTETKKGFKGEKGVGGGRKKGKK